eukprot:5164425-Prymnesium_polylepis.1
MGHRPSCVPVVFRYYDYDITIGLEAEVPLRPRFIRAVNAGRGTPLSRVAPPRGLRAYSCRSGRRRAVAAAFACRRVRTTRWSCVTRSGRARPPSIESDAPTATMPRCGATRAAAHGAGPDRNIGARPEPFRRRAAITPQQHEADIDPVGAPRTRADARASHRPDAVVWEPEVHGECRRAQAKSRTCGPRHRSPHGRHGRVPAPPASQPPRGVARAHARHLLLHAVESPHQPRATVARVRFRLREYDGSDR